MTKEMLNKVNEYCETGSYFIMREIEEYCAVNNLFLDEDEDTLQIEDETFKLNF